MVVGRMYDQDLQSVTFSSSNFSVLNQGKQLWDDLKEAYLMNILSSTKLYNSRQTAIGTAWSTTTNLSETILATNHTKKGDYYCN